MQAVQTNSIQKDSSAWLFFVRFSFALSLITTTFGIGWIPVTWWVKGYLWMGLYFTVASTITMVKTIRDEHEANKLVKRVAEARTEKLLAEYEGQKANA